MSPSNHAFLLPMPMPMTVKNIILCCCGCNATVQKGFNDDKKIVFCMECYLMDIEEYYKYEGVRRKSYEVNESVMHSTLGKTCFECEMAEVGEMVRRARWDKKIKNEYYRHKAELIQNQKSVIYDKACQDWNNAYPCFMAASLLRNKTYLANEEARKVYMTTDTAYNAAAAAFDVEYNKYNELCEAKSAAWKTLNEVV